MIYRRKHTVTAFRWFRNGDHPLDYANPVLEEVLGTTIEIPAEECRAAGREGQFVRYYPDAHRDAVCPQCRQKVSEHGVINGTDLVVCPGSWVAQDNDSGSVAVFTHESFTYNFEPVKEQQ